MLEKEKKYEEAEEDEDALREMTDYEKALMKKFEENDEEIDEMLDQVITDLEQLRLHAEGINTAIMSQKEIIKRLNNKAERARINL